MVTSGAMSRSVSVVVRDRAATGAFLVEEGFEDSNLESRGWYDLGPLVRSTVEAHSGSGSLELRFLQGANQAVGGGARHLFDETESVYLSYWAKYSQNWVGSGRPRHPHEFFLLTNADGRYVGPASTHLTVYVEHVHEAGGNVPWMRAQDSQNIDQSRLNQDLTGVTEDRAANGCNGSVDPHPTTCGPDVGGIHGNRKYWSASQPYFLDAPGPGYKNDWHHVEAYVQLNSIENGIGVNDGVIQYWFDGQLVINHHDVLLRTGAWPGMRFNQLLVGPFIGVGSPVEQTLWIDDLRIATARP
jgi:hypothetical protein